jgi:hypothetical protein
MFLKFVNSLKFTLTTPTLHYTTASPHSHLSNLDHPALPLKLAQIIPSRRVVPIRTHTTISFIKTSLCLSCHNLNRTTKFIHWTLPPNLCLIYVIININVFCYYKKYTSQEIFSPFAFTTSTWLKNIWMRLVNRRYIKSKGAYSLSLNVQKTNTKNKSLRLFYSQNPFSAKKGLVFENKLFKLNVINYLRSEIQPDLFSGHPT